tara:strand:- start:24 stop:188 length:165 start_codon:yes stop_codon:yes gene_type:complete
MWKPGGKFQTHLKNPNPCGIRIDVEIQTHVEIPNLCGNSNPCGNPNPVKNSKPM